MMSLAKLQPYKIIQLVCLLSAGVGRHAVADSITLSETWKDNTKSGIYSSSTDTGVFNASLTVSNLSGFSATDWSNLEVSVISSVLITGGDLSGDQSYFSDNLGDAPAFGGTFSATSATFFFPLSNTNGNLVSAYKLTFSRSGNILTIAGQTLNPAAVQPPWSIDAYYYLDYSGSETSFTLAAQADCEIVLQDQVSLNQYADFVRPIFLSVTDTITYDSQGNELNSVGLSGAADFTPPALTAVAPLGALTTTNDLLTVQVKATDNVGVANVEFYVNGFDYGSGVPESAGLWSLNFALLPGTNVIVTQAADLSGNLSPSNRLAVTYVNAQTNASLITVSEHWQDSSQTNSAGGVNDESQDVGTLNAALPVAGLSSLSASAWSNLVLRVSFGDLTFSNRLAAAAVLTASNAIFYLNTTYDANANLVPDEQLSVARAGNTLVLAAETGNPTYDYNHPLVANVYLGLGGPILDEIPFALTLQDGNTLQVYTNFSLGVQIAGTDVVSLDANGGELDNVQLAGAAQFSTTTPPTLTALSPTGPVTTTNALLTVQVKATDNYGVSNVEFYVNNQDYGSGVAGGDYSWSLRFALLPGTNLIQSQATDVNGNSSPRNSLAVTYVNPRTNANAITVSEFWLDSSPTNLARAVVDVSQDVGALNAALLVPGLQNLSASTWSNLVLTLSFGDVAFSSRLAAAAVVTASNAIFHLNPFQQLSVARASNTLVLAFAAGNPASAFNAGDNHPILANDYLGSAGTIQDQKPFALTLQDGTTSYAYASVARPVFLAGTNTITLDPQANALNNLQLAGMADFIPPTNLITAPLAGQRWSNAVFTLTGRAGDNVAVSNVFYSLNHGGWSNAVPVNHWSNWTAQVTLIPGTNTVAAYAVDTSGNVSATNTVTFVYVLSGVLTVNVGAGGTVAPNDNGAPLQLGQYYTLTATTNVGFVFAGWTGSITTNSAVLTFQMASNLVLNANFLETAKPALTITSPANGQRLTNALAYLNGTAADAWGVRGVWLQVNSNAWSLASSTNAYTNWNSACTLVAGTNTLRAYARNLGGNYSPTNLLSVVSSNTFLLHLGLTNAPLAAGGLSLHLQISPGLNGHLQFSTNLLTWIMLTNFVGTNTSLTAYDPSATNSPRRFYRAAIP